MADNIYEKFKVSMWLYRYVYFIIKVSCISAVTINYHQGRTIPICSKIYGHFFVIKSSNLVHLFTIKCIY